MSKYQEYVTQIKAKSEAVNALFDQADQKGGDDDGVRDQIVTLNKEIEELEKRAADAKAMDELRAANDGRLVHLGSPSGGFVHPSGTPASRHDAMAKAVQKSLAETFIESDEWQSFIKSVAPTGQINGNPRIQSPTVMVPKGLDALRLKTLVTGTSSTSGGAFVVNEQSGIYEPLGRRPLNLLDIISRRTTGSDTVEFVRQTSRGNAAATVAEATATSGSSGVKPEGAMAYERVTATVKTIAEWVAATKRALSDAGQMRGLIEDELRGDLLEELEDQVMNGGGTGEDFEGIDTVSGTQDQAWDTNILTTTRKARTLVRTVGRDTPTAYLFSPGDWQTIDLLQDNEARYFFGGPMVLGTPRLWGLPVVESEALSNGFGWVANWSKAVLWDREQTSISVSDSHADFFIRNLVAVLGELRAAFAVIKPVAFVEIDTAA